MVDNKQPKTPVASKEQPPTEEMRQMVREEVEELRHLTEKLRRKVN